MNAEPTRAITVQASLPETFAALQEAARRSGLRYLTGDVETGLAVFSAGFTAMAFGEKVSARLAEAGPGSVQVTFSPDPQFGIVGWWGRQGEGIDVLVAELQTLLPRAD